MICLWASNVNSPPWNSPYNYLYLIHPSSFLLQVKYYPYTLTNAFICTWVHCYFYPLLKNSMVLCHFRKKMPSNRALWNKTVFTSHKVRSLLGSQFTTSPYFTFARNYFKTADFPFYAHSSVFLCSLTLRITLALFTEEKQAVLFPLLKSDLWRSWHYNSSAFSSFSPNSCFHCWPPCAYTPDSSGSCSVHFLVDGSQFLELVSWLSWI